LNRRHLKYEESKKKKDKVIRRQDHKDIVGNFQYSVTNRVINASRAASIAHRHHSGNILKAL